MKKSITIFSMSPKILPKGYDYSSPINKHIEGKIRGILSEYDPNNTAILSSLPLGPEKILAKIAQENDFKTVAVLPCLGQDDRWYERERATYHDLILSSNEVINITKTLYTPSCIQEKNHYLIKNSDIFIMISSKKRPEFDLLVLEKQILEVKKQVIFIDIEEFL